MTPNRQDDIQQLNSFLRGELSAVETYDQAIQKLSADPAVRLVLEECKTSHTLRAKLLRNEVERLGGEPAADSGAWGSLVKLLEGGATMLGKVPTIAVLEEGEDHGMRDYQSDRDELTPYVRQFVESKIIPEQAQTHARMSALKHPH